MLPFMVLTMVLLSVLPIVLLIVLLLVLFSVPFMVPLMLLILVLLVVLLLVTLRVPVVLLFILHKQIPTVFVERLTILTGWSNLVLQRKQEAGVRQQETDFNT